MGDDGMDKFVGKWEVVGSENMDEMLRAFDMAEEKRAFYKDMKFVMEYQREDDNKWICTVYMLNGLIKSFTFVIGEEFDSTTLDGRPIKSTVRTENGKFIESMKDKVDPTLDAVMIREVLDDQLIVTAKVRDITSITRHKKIL